jgi:hypothetical protein
MTHRLSRRFAVLAGVLATALAAMALATSSASASPYCGGAQSNQFSTCFGAARVLTGVTGYGTTTSACVGANEIFGACSGGPRQLASHSFGSAANRVPWIRGNATTVTTVFGETF